MSNIKKLPLNPDDHSDPGPTHRPDGSKISKKSYMAKRKGQTDEEYKTMLRRIPNSMYGLLG